MAFYIALWSDPVRLAADRVARLYARSDQLCSAAPCSDEPGDALSVSGSMILVFGQAAWKRFEASFARKSLPCSSVRAFPPHRLAAAAKAL